MDYLPDLCKISYACLRHRVPAAWCKTCAHNIQSSFATSVCNATVDPTRRQAEHVVTQRCTFYRAVITGALSFSVHKSTDECSRPFSAPPQTAT